MLRAGHLGQQHCVQISLSQRSSDGVKMERRCGQLAGNRVRTSGALPCRPSRAIRRKVVFGGRYHQPGRGAATSKKSVMSRPLARNVGKVISESAVGPVNRVRNELMKQPGAAALTRGSKMPHRW